jgi:hypothetical protein
VLDIERLSWMDRAACIGMPVAVFFPQPGQPSDDARRTCERCVVAVDCARFAVDQTVGVWGGRLVAYDRDDDERDERKPLKARRAGAYRSSARPTRTPPPAEEADMASTKTTTDEQPTDTGRGRSTVSQEGNAKCPSCRKQLPVTAFPTARQKDGTYQRSLAECRSCRDTRRATKKAEKEASKSTAA